MKTKIGNRFDKNRRKSLMANLHTESEKKTIFNKKFILTITIFAIIILILHHFISTQISKERTYRIISENNGTYMIVPSVEPSIFTMNIFELINHFYNPPIDKETFCTSNIKHISLPDTMQTIPNDAFENCSNLQTVSIPNSVESIGNGAFEILKELNCHIQLHDTPIFPEIFILPMHVVV